MKKIQFPRTYTSKLNYSPLICSFKILRAILFTKFYQIARIATG